jgi:hypothetical protein
MIAAQWAKAGVAAVSPPVAEFLPLAPAAVLAAG